MLPYPPLTALPNTLLIMLSLLSTFPLSLMFNPGLTKIEIFFSFFWGGGRWEGKGEGITGRGGYQVSGEVLQRKFSKLL